MDLVRRSYRKFSRIEPLYDLVDDDSSQKLLLCDHETHNGMDGGRLHYNFAELEKLRGKRFATRFFCLSLLNLALFVATATIGTTAMLQLRRNENNFCARETSAHSPVFDGVPIKFHQEKVNATVWAPKNPGWKRKEINDPEAEKMWSSFEVVEHFPITRADVVALGKDPEFVARFPDEIFGFGDDAYVGALDIQHKLHCLNELRKMAFSYYRREAPAKKYHGKLWWHHLRHCLEIVTEDLICHADADIVTYRWTDVEHWPFPDFSVNRKCRSFDDLLRWRDEHMVNPELYAAEMTKPAGIHQMPHEPSYYAEYGFYWSTLYPNGTGYPEELPNTDGWWGLPATRDHG